MSAQTPSQVIRVGRTTAGDALDGVADDAGSDGGAMLGDEALGGAMLRDEALGGADGLG